MCLHLISFRAPSATLKQKNYHNSANMQPIIPYFQVLFKFIKRHLLTLVSKSLNMFYLCFLFFINFQRHMLSICVWNMTKHSNPLQTRYDSTYIYDRYYIRTHIYMCSFLVCKNACLNYREFDLEGNLVGYPIHGIYRPSLSLDY